MSAGSSSPFTFLYLGVEKHEHNCRMHFKSKNAEEKAAEGGPGRQEDYSKSIEEIYGCCEGGHGCGDPNGNSPKEKMTGISGRYLIPRSPEHISI